jgi:hypothetical protein
MTQSKRAIGGKLSGAKARQPAAERAAPAPTGLAGLPLPSPVAATNLVIADIVLRAAGGLLRERMEKGMLIKSYNKAKAERLVGGRSFTTSMALWGASRLARRSPLGLAVVVGGLAAKVFYDHGKRLEAGRAEGEAARSTPTDET